MTDFSLAFARDVLVMMKNFLKSFKIQTKYGTTAGATASSVIISGIGLMLIYAYTQRKKEKKTQRVFTRSMSIGALHGGRIAMKRMLQYHKMRANQEIQHHYLETLENMTNTDTPDFPHIQVKHLTFTIKQVVWMLILIVLMCKRTFWQRWK